MSIANPKLYAKVKKMADAYILKLYEEMGGTYIEKPKTENKSSGETLEKEREQYHKDLASRMLLAKPLKKKTMIGKGLIQFSGTLFMMLIEVFKSQTDFWDYIGDKLDESNKKKVFSKESTGTSFGNVIRDMKFNNWGSGYTKTIKIFIQSAIKIVKKNSKYLQDFIKNEKDINDHYRGIFNDMVSMFKELPFNFNCRIKNNLLVITYKSR